MSFRLYKAAMVVKKNMRTQRIGNLENFLKRSVKRNVLGLYFKDSVHSSVRILKNKKKVLIFKRKFS